MENLVQMKILIVDDDTISRKFLKNILNKNNFNKIQLLNSGEEALELVFVEPPDLILLDIVMPGIAGYEVCEKIRTNEATAHIPILMVTGGAIEAEEAVEKSFKAGATDFITKPVRHIEFLSRVKSALTIKKHHDQLADELEKRLQAEKEKEKIIVDLKDALANVKKLSGLLPICSYCKQIRDDKGYWNQIEEYLCSHTEAGFTHSICPLCVKKHHPDLNIHV